MIFLRRTEPTKIWKPTTVGENQQKSLSPPCTVRNLVTSLEMSGDGADLKPHPNFDVHHWYMVVNHG